MPIDCRKLLSRNQRKDCNNPLSKGLDETIYIGMRDGGGWAATFDAMNPKIITNITPTGTAKLYAYEGRNYSNGAEVSFAQSEYDNNFPHSVSFKIFSESPETDREIEALCTRKDLFVVAKRVNGPHKVFGYLTGLKVSAYSYNPLDDATKGAHSVTLTAIAEIGMPHTLIHKTLTLEDTAVWLQTLVAADPA